MADLSEFPLSRVLLILGQSSCCPDHHFRNMIRDLQRSLMDDAREVRELSYQPKYQDTVESGKQFLYLWRDILSQESWQPIIFTLSGEGYPAHLLSLKRSVRNQELIHP